ncbi:MAG: TraB/GumN family protein [Verrucomicrobiota bacterium]
MSSIRFTLLALPFFALCTAGAKDNVSRAPIWELKGESATVFLAGSVHLLREKDLPLPEGFDEVYEQADRVVFELDFAEMTNPATAMAIQRQGMLPQGESLSDHFEEETLKKILEFAGDLGLPAAVIERMRPGMIMVTLTSLNATRQGARPDLGIEMQFFQKANEDGKPTSGLETMEFQMGVFHRMSTETVTRLIVEMIDEQDEAEEALDDIIGAWKSGDPKQIEEIIVSELADEKEVRELLLDERNQNWITPIEEALKGDENVLFIVGAAHLAGEGSVIDLLEKKGYEPKHLFFTPALP